MSLLNSILDTSSLHEHLAVMYATPDQIATGIWGETFSLEWDPTYGFPIFSNRWMIPILIVGGILLTYGSMLLFFFIYNAYWCLQWDANFGNSKYAFCLQPQVDSLKG